MNTDKQRKITVELIFDWEDCEDVCAELMVEDGIEVLRKGVSFNILKDSHNVPDKRKRKQSIKLP